MRALSPVATSSANEATPRCSVWASHGVASLVGRAGALASEPGPSYSAGRGIFLDQGSNLHPLHWQARSFPLHGQGSPTSNFNMKLDLEVNLI